MNAVPDSFRMMQFRWWFRPYARAGGKGAHSRSCAPRVPRPVQAHNKIEVRFVADVVARQRLTPQSPE